jgi:hypothetical protein
MWVMHVLISSIEPFYNVGMPWNVMLYMINMYKFYLSIKRIKTNEWVASEGDQNQKPFVNKTKALIEKPRKVTISKRKK